MSEANSLLMKLVSDERMVMALLNDIDKKARESNAYELGLPLYDEDRSARLREVVYRWAARWSHGL